MTYGNLFGIDPMNAEHIHAKCVLVHAPLMEGVNPTCRAEVVACFAGIPLIQTQRVFTGDYLEVFALNSNHHRIAFCAKRTVADPYAASTISLA
jgi:hypothetical protein